MGLLSWITKRLNESNKNYVKFWTGKMKPCPLCGHKAELIHYCGENNPEFWDVECGDFEDHGAWNLDGKCHFNCNDGMEDVPRHYTIADAVLYWNEVVVPIGVAARKAMVRMNEYREGKRRRFDSKGVTLPRFEEDEEKKTMFIKPPTTLRCCSPDLSVNRIFAECQEFNDFPEFS